MYKEVKQFLILSNYQLVFGVYICFEYQTCFHGIHKTLENIIVKF